jgi:hypothetical protein
MGNAQNTGDIIAGVNLDLIKTDNVSYLNKAQIGLEGNYFVARGLTVTGGFEIWTGDEVSFVVGGRWFVVEDAFIRLRALLGENDISLGAGWTKPISDDFRFEAIGDFYFSIDFAIRAGLVYVIRH